MTTMMLSLSNGAQQLYNHAKAENFQFEKLDIENKNKLANFFIDYGPFDAVLNLAARAGVRYSIANPHIYLSTNAEGSLNLLECMRENGCQSLSLHLHHRCMPGKRCRLLRILL